MSLLDHGQKIEVEEEEEDLLRAQRIRQRRHLASSKSLVWHARTRAPTLSSNMTEEAWKGYEKQWNKWDEWNRLYNAPPTQSAPPVNTQPVPVVAPPVPVKNTQSVPEPLQALVAQPAEAQATKQSAASQVAQSSALVPKESDGDAKWSSFQTTDLYGPQKVARSRVCIIMAVVVLVATAITATILVLVVKPPRQWDDSPEDVGIDNVKCTAANPGPRVTTHTRVEGTSAASARQTKAAFTEPEETTGIASTPIVSSSTAEQETPVRLPVPVACVFQTVPKLKRHITIDDGLCDCFIYSPVYFVSGAISPVGDVDIRRYEHFLASCAAYNRTKCLIGFRRSEMNLKQLHKFARADDAQLILLTQHNICGYGIMEVNITSTEQDFFYMSRAVQILKNAHDRVLLSSGGCGVFVDTRLYSPGEYSQKGKLLQALTNVGKVDFVILETHVTGLSESSECYTNPIGPWNKQSLNDKRQPNFVDVLECIDDIPAVLSSIGTLFLSSSLSMVEYLISTPVPVTIFRYRCESLALLEYNEVICPTADQYDNTSVSGITAIADRLYAFETASTLKEKAGRVLQHYESLSRNMFPLGWAVFHTEYIGNASTCYSLERVRDLKDFLNQRI